MVERIRAILQARQLSPTQFADAIGVARPIVSHILSGRNKPSLEVVQKIIGAFPELSIAWLLTGTEPMVAATEPVAAPTPVTPVEVAQSSASAVEAAQKRPRAVTSHLAAAAEAGQPPVRTETPPPTPVEPTPVVVPAPDLTAPAVAPNLIPAAPVASASLPTTPEQPSTAQPAATTAPASVLALAEPGKKIRRIVIFYQDGTFADYQPE
ncbi:helix-turn-helix domain-containing protein [Hymenobacter chitinivorans]|uniref:Helix-turn-helix protein n=1 Tax=Hymenobacter chitinivorans DSM 11115 TaxID=1121954 RepID=A0A2M9BRZ4_9BACT|nr:helix-turn-helix protein [Hymenobacter chitinivorans DSM 11115]